MKQHKDNYKFPSLQNGTGYPLRTATVEEHDSNPSPFPCNHCTRGGSLQNNGNVRSPILCPPPLPLSPWMSCHLSMKECQVFSLTGSSCSSGSLDASKGWRCGTGKTTLLSRLFFRLPPLVSHLPVSIMYKEIYD